VRLHVNEGSSGDGLLTDDNTTTLGETVVNTTDGIFGALDFDEEDGFLEAGASGELGGVNCTSSSGHDLTTTSVDSIGVEGDIMEVESNTSHVLVGENTFFGGPLEGTFHGVLDFVKELDGLGNINEQVGTSGLGSETPDLECIIGVPFEFISEHDSADLGVLLGGDLFVIDGLGKVITERFGGDEESVMLVGGLGKADLRRFFRDGFLVLDNGVSFSDGALGEIFFEILEANFDMEFSTSGNNVLTGSFGGDLDEGVGLGELSETFDELGEIGGVLDLDGDTHDGGDGVLHNTDAACVFEGGDGSLFDEVLIDTDEGDGVTARYIGDSLDLTSHHDDGSLDVLNVEVSLGSLDVVGSQNSDFLSGGDGSGEDTTEGIESTLVVGGDHLGDEDHESGMSVTVSDSFAGLVVLGSFIKVSSSVLLGDLGRGELHDDLLEEGLSGVNPFLEDALEERLESEFLLLSLELELKLFAHLPDTFEVLVKDVSAHGDDRSHDELDEASGESFTIVTSVLGAELLVLRVEVVITPKLLHELVLSDIELLGVGPGESGESEGPSEKSGSEGDGTESGVNLLGFSHVFALVGGDDNVSVFNNTAEVLIHSFTIDLEFEDTSVNFVDHENGLDLLGESLSKDGLGLDADTFDVIDDDESTISNSEGGGDFGGEIDMTG